MIKLSVLVSLVASASARYNILSLDGAKYKGYMTAAFVEYMEENAYNAAVRDYCFPARDSSRIAMHELFDMITGSETGAIIASTLVLPNTNTTSPQKNLYWATTAREWFETNTLELYHNSKLSFWYNGPLAAILAGLVAWVVYTLVETAYLDKDFDEHSKDIAFLLKVEKRKAKGLKVDAPEYKEKFDKVVSVLGDGDVVKHGELIEVFKAIKKCTEMASIDEGTDAQDFEKV